MACFLVPMGEAIVTTAITKVVKKKEAKKQAAEQTEMVALPAEGETLPMSKKLAWLDYMLWGGSALLCLEHIWHGEVTLAFPFLTAATEAGGVSTILHEMGTVGVSMSVLVTLVWGGVLAFSKIRSKRPVTAEPIPVPVRQEEHE